MVGRPLGVATRAVWTRSLGATPHLGVGYSAPLAGSSLARIIETGQPRIINGLEQYLLLASAVLAGALPARRAARIAPMQALRQD